jgi:ribosome maturation factor RimP
MASVSDRILALTLPILSDLGLELYDFEFAGGVVRVTIDKAGGVDLEAIAEVTRNISRELDHADPIEATYTLEVSSPGLERALRTPAHFTKARGMTVKVKLLPGGPDDQRRIEGLLVGSDDDTFTVATENGDRTASIDRVERARTVFEWGGQPKPSSQPRRPAAASTGAAAPAVRRPRSAQQEDS